MINKVSNFVSETVRNNLMSSIYSLLPPVSFATRTCQTMGDAGTVVSSDYKMAFYYKDYVCVPDGQSWLQVLKLCHVTPLAGQFSYFKNWNLVSRTFLWPGLHTSVKQCIKSVTSAPNAQAQGFLVFSSPCPLHLSHGPPYLWTLLWSCRALKGIQ